MNNRYVATVVKVLSNYDIVVNAGKNKNLENGQVFLVVGLGDEIIDPDSGESLGQMEIVRGKVTVSHTQEKLATLSAFEAVETPGTREIKKVTVSPSGRGGLATMFGGQDTVTESVTPGTKTIRALVGVAEGDKLLNV